MKVAVSWWSPTDMPGGGSQAIRGNTKAFLDAGHDVDLYYLDAFDRLQEHADSYDLILLPYITHTLETTAHVHLQIGGYGRPDRDPEQIVACIESADTVSVLDPRIASHLNRLVGLDLETTRLIPNPPNRDLFHKEPQAASDGTVLVPKLGGGYKTGDYLAEVAQKTPSLTYHALAAEETPAMPSNVHIRPAVPLSAMPIRYTEAEVVFNPAVRETLPNVAYEAFMSHRPYVARQEAIGLLQTIPADVLDADDFGSTVAWWMDAYRNRYYGGDQVVLAGGEDAEGAASVLQWIMGDMEVKRDAAEAGVVWIETVFRNWGWAEKADAITDLTD